MKPHRDRKIISLIALSLVSASLLLSTHAAIPASPAKLPFTISKETTVITSPLLPDGTPDYFTALNARFNKDVTSQNNAYVAWLALIDTHRAISSKSHDRFLEMCGAKDTPPETQLLDNFATFLKKEGRLNGPALDARAEIIRNLNRQLWTPEAFPDVAAYLKAREKQLNLAVDAVKRSHWWIPYVGEPGAPLVTFMIPSLAEVRDASSALAARATLRLRTNDFPGFLDDLRAIKQLARHVGSGATLIERLVGLAVEQVANTTAATAAASGTLTEAQCRDLAREWSAFPPPPELIDAVDFGERLSIVSAYLPLAFGRVDDFLTNIHGQGESPDADKRFKDIAAMVRSIQTAQVDWDAVLKAANQSYDDQIRALRAPTVQQIQDQSAAIDKRIEEWNTTILNSPSVKAGRRISKDAAESRDAYTQKVAHAILPLLVPSVGNAQVQYLRCQMQNQMALTLLEAAAQRAKTGAWPKQLPLAPGQTEIPRDIYSANGQDPVKYLLTPAGPRVYSIGQNHTDDAGINDRPNNKDDIAIGAP